MSNTLNLNLDAFEPKFNADGNIQCFGNQLAGNAPLIVGPKCCLVQCSGPDAAAFLNRLTTIKPSQISIGDGQVGFLLTAQGKIRFGFDCYRHDAQTFQLFSHPSQGEQLLKSLDMFHFGEDLRLNLKGTWMTVLTERAAPLLKADDNIRTISSWRNHVDRCVNFMPPDVLQKQLENISIKIKDLGGMDAFTMHRVNEGISSHIAEWSDKYTPLDVNAQYGVIQQKGCYPGQEVIERTLAIGRPARKLVKINAQKLQRGDVIATETGREVGLITTAYNDDSKGVAVGLAVVKYGLDSRETYASEGESVFLSDISD